MLATDERERPENEHGTDRCDPDDFLRQPTHRRALDPDPSLKAQLPAHSACEVEQDDYPRHEHPDQKHEGSLSS